MKLSKKLSHTFCGLQISCSQNILAEKEEIMRKIQETEPSLAVNNFSLLPLIPWSNYEKLILYL